MGNLKIFWIFGYERWGGLRPAYCTLENGDKFKPWKFGIWIKCSDTRMGV